MTNEVATTQANAVTAFDTAGLPADLAGIIGQDAGRGLSTKAEDNLVPLIYVLQDNSPQAKERDPDYVEGAKTGDIWLRSSLNPIVKGEEGIWFQPCYFSKDFVEWVPRKQGGGLVDRYAELPADATQQTVAGDDGGERKVFVRPNGNEIVETRYHTGLVYRDGEAPQPYVIPLKSTGHTFSRQFMFLMNGVTAGGKKAPSFSRLYRLVTKAKSNAAGDWFGWDIAESKWAPSSDVYNRGRDLCDAMEAGDKTIAVDNGDAPEATGDAATKVGDTF